MSQFYYRLKRMKRTLRKVFRFLPRAVRFYLIRKMVNINSPFEKEELQIEIASGQQDFETAFRLLHDCYVGSGLMDAHVSGLRCNSYSFLPNTAIIILKKGVRVIGTVSLIRDSTMGLPSDEKYKIENDTLRNEGKVLTEVSALAIDVEFRNQGHLLNLLLMKFLYNYTKKYSDSNYLVCTIHPRAEDFYSALWGFKRRGSQVSYGYVKGALAIYMFMELSEANERKVVASYRSENPYKNLGLYCLQKDNRFIYPAFESGQVIEVRMTPDVLNYFFKEKTDLFNELSEFHKQMFFEIYYFHFAGQGIESYFVPSEKHRVREYRTPTKINANLKYNEVNFHSEIIDLSSQGCFVVVKSLTPIDFKIGDETTIEFILGQKKFLIQGQCAWMNNRDNSRYPVGIGIRFKTDILFLSAELKKWSHIKGDDPKKIA